MIYNNILDMIGNTPYIKLNGTIYMKLESYNPTGSVKDRAALGMILDAEKSGTLQEGMIIVEPTSGNTGIALSMIAKVKGYSIKIVMPSSMSIERVNIMKAYGAEVILTPAKEGMDGAINLAKEMSKKKGYFMPSQFSNPSNSNYHYHTTGLEIIKDFPDIDAFIAGIGTGGTISGVGKRLKEYNPEVKIIGIEPKESAVLSGMKKGPHKIQGIGAGFKPDILELEWVDHIVSVEYSEAKLALQKIVSTTGFLPGISAAAAVASALKFSKEHPELKKILVIVPDDGQKYLSTDFLGGDGE